MIYQRHVPIEELRDMLGKLKYDAQFLNRCGELGDSVAVFYGLSLEERLMLLYLAFVEGDKETQDVARHLMGTLDLETMPQGPEDLLLMLSARAKAELRRPGEAESRPIEESDRLRFLEQLKQACDQIGFLRAEQAYWILMPERPSDESIWIKAFGRGNDSLARSEVVFDDRTTHSLGEKEMQDILAAMRGARWALHVHNHPRSTSPNYIALCAPSSEDERFASRWKSTSPGLGHKMKFFVLQDNRAVEYALPRGEVKRWI